MVKLKRVYESSLFTEAQKDLDDLKDHLGDDLYNDYMKIRDRIPKDQNDYKDFQKLKKLPIEDVQNFVDNFQSETDKRKEAKKGAKKIFSDSDWDIYKIITYPAAVYYGSGTKWCITGRYPGHEGRGEEYFNDYINKKHLDGGYYFCIDRSNPSRKYCVLRYNDGGVDSIWVPEDSEISDVDPYDVPGDLPNDVPYNGFNLGEEIQVYVEDNGGSNYDPIEGLADALSVDPNDMDLGRIEDLADRAGEYGLEDFDYFYDCLVQGRELKDTKLKAFEILLNEEVPTENWIKEHYLDEKCLLSLINAALDGSSYYNSSYFDIIFWDIVEVYSKYNYSFIQDLNLLYEIINNCSKKIFSSYEIESDNFYNILNAFDKNIVLEKLFIKSLFDHGMDQDDFITYLDDLEGTDKEQLRIPLLKTAVEAKLVDLNDILTSWDHKPTVFMNVLLQYEPKVDDVKWMIAHGANPDLKDGDGDTAIEWTDDSKIEELLK